MNNFLRVVPGAIVAIILGAIGSGLWERVLSPAFTYIANFITAFIASLSDSYSNYIYERASNIALYDETASLASIIMVFVSLFLFFYAVNATKDQRFFSMLHRAFLLQFSGFIGIIQSAALFFASLFLLTTQYSVSYIQYKSLKNIEIIRPHVGEPEYHSLKSLFLQIKSKSEYEAINEKII